MAKKRAAASERRIYLAAFLAAALAVGFLAMRFVLSRGKGDSIAVLKAKAGLTERDFGKSAGNFAAAELGAEFTVGDGVRTGKDGTASLELADRSALRLENSTLVRFLDRPSGQNRQRMEVQMGEAVLEAGDSPVSLDTEIGVAVLTPGTKMSVTKAGGATRYEVVVGLAHFESKDGEKTDVAAGQTVSVGIGAAKLERYVPSSPSGTAPAAPSGAAPAAPAEASDGDVTARVTGSGAVVRAPGSAAFTRLQPGEGRIPGGSTVRLSTGTSAEVSRAAQHVTLRGAGEFVVGQGGQPFIVSEGGGVTLTGAGSEVEIAVPGGSIVARLGARGDVGVGKETAHVSVSAGAVELRSASGTEELAAGEDGSIGKKGAEVQGRGPSYVDMTIAAGASFAVHDPHPPTSIGFSTASVCPEGATIQLAGGPRIHSGSTTSVNVLVGPGAHRYTVRCIGSDKDVRASGAVVVLADSGTARIPRTAPATAVDTDGRSYTVMYQNLLPKITVRWPGAPAGGGYTLHLSSGEKSESFPSSTPSHSFASGALREGEHRVSFEGGGTRSKETRVEIKFDNAAPTATLTSPANGSFPPGAAVTVSGIALEGWRVSAGGQELPLDDQGRFSGQATAPAGQRALAIEFVHPKRGLHYYLRRAAAP